MEVSRVGTRHMVRNAKTAWDEPRCQDLAKSWADKAEEKQIYIGHLFTSPGFDILKCVIRELDAVPRDRVLINGYRDLGAYLGAHQCIPQIYENGIRPSFGPTAGILWDRRKVPLCHFISALIKMKRLDIVSMIEDHMPTFLEAPVNHSVEQLIPIPIESCDTLEEFAAQFRYTRRAPIINSLSNQLPIQEQPRRTTVRPDMVVYLTYGEDGIEDAREIARIIRQPREDGLRIGVLLMDEHRTEFETDPKAILEEFYTQVRFTLPIITPGYLDSLSSPDVTSAATNLDVKLVPHAYRLMLGQYDQNWYKNKNVRCIVPDRFSQVVPQRTDFNRPLFSAWFSTSELETLLDKFCQLIK